MIQINQSKYKSVTSNPDAYLEKAEVINFDMIYARCGQPQQYSDKHYQTIRGSDAFEMSQKEKKKAVSACLCSECKNLFVEKNRPYITFQRNRIDMSTYETFDLWYNTMSSEKKN